MFVEITPKQDSELNYVVGTAYVKAGQPYIMHESWVSQIPGGVSMLESRFRKYNINEDVNGKSILMMRTIGGGDILFMSALAAYIKNKYPECTIDFALVDKQHSLISILKDINKAVSIPLESNIFDSYNYHIEVSGLIEGKDNLDRNAYDVYFEHIGVNPDDVDDEFKRPHIKDINAPKNNILIGFHPFAHDPIRTLDPQLANELALELDRNGYTVIILSDEEEKKVYHTMFDPKFKWSIDTHKDFRSLTQLISSCQYTVSTDSLISHLSQAVGTSNISIYGPFASETRSKYYKNMTVVDTYPDCRCSLHHVGQCPKGFTFSPCLNIDPSIITSIIKENTDTTPIATLNDAVVSEYNMEI